MSGHLYLSLKSKTSEVTIEIVRLRKMGQGVLNIARWVMGCRISHDGSRGAEYRTMGQGGLGIARWVKGC